MVSEGMRPIIIKLGGSVLTRKREAPRVRLKVLSRLAHEVARCGSRPLILLHGAGSFGHPGALRFRLATGPSVPGAADERRRGAAIVSAEVRRLHSRVLAALVEAHTNPWSVPPSTHAVNREGRLVHFDDTAFRFALARGVLAASFGDVVPDETWGFSILSADTIAIDLARTLGAERVVFVSDVPGILAQGTDGRRRVVPEVTPAVIESLAPAPGTPDVTGGIRAKAEAMWAIAGAGVDAGLISGLTDGALLRAVRGDSSYGSWARARPG